MSRNGSARFQRGGGRRKTDHLVSGKHGDTTNRSATLCIAYLCREKASSGVVDEFG
jgi:hypothetical protein